MLSKIVALATVVALAALLTPSRVGAWGAAHVGYTRVGPGGGGVPRGPNRRGWSPRRVRWRPKLWLRGLGRGLSRRVRRRGG
jgi:hypothetical protein